MHFDCPDEFDPESPYNSSAGVDARIRQLVKYVGDGIAAGEMPEMLAVADLEVSGDGEAIEALLAAKPGCDVEALVGSLHFDDLDPSQSPLFGLGCLLALRGAYDGSPEPVVLIDSQSFVDFSRREAAARGFFKPGSPIEDCIDWDEYSDLVLREYSGADYGDQTFYFQKPLD